MEKDFHLFHVFNTMIKLTVLATICLVGSMAVSGTNVLDKPYYDLENAEALFHDFMKQYRKIYSRKEYVERLEIFKESLKNINHRNDMFPETVFGVNHFADLKPEELLQYGGSRRSNRTGVKVTIPDILVDLPKTFDWRDKGIVSPVKSQGCDDYYIFSALANIEGQYNLKYKQCISLAEQQALDCLRCGSCGGGVAFAVMREFVNRSVGPMLGKDYPYVGEQQRCKEDASKAVVHVLAEHIIYIPEEKTLKQKLVEIGPLAVDLAAQDLQFYVEGILHPHLCKGEEPNHAVLLVGYGEENGTKYWIIKNSWGTEWGEKGYLRLLRGVDACRMGTSGTYSAIVA